MNRLLILIVEDDAIIRERLEMTIERWGYAVLTTDRGEVAVQLAVDQDPALILMDIRLKDKMTGVEAAAAIAKTKATPVVYLTAYAEEGILAKAKATGPFGYLTKPVRDQDLRATIEMALYKSDMERRLQEKNRELEKSTERLREAQKLAKVGQWELDLTNNLLEWSPGVFDMFEIDPEKFETTYDDFLEAVHPEDRNKVKKAYADSLKTNTPYTVYHRLLMKDGRVKQVREACRHELDENGTPIRSIGVVQDITDLKAIEDALRESEARFRGLVENSSDWIWEVDASGRYTYCSPAANAILGYEPRELLGKRFSDLVDENHRNEVMDRYSEIMKAGESFSSLENQVRRKDGRIVTLGSRGAPIVDQDGKQIGYRGIDRDITERKNVEEKLNLQKQMLHGILAAIQESAFLIDTEGRLLFANPTLADRLGVTVEALVGKRIIDLIPEDLHRSRMEKVRKAIQTRKPVQFEDVRTGRHIENRIYPLIDTDKDRVTGLVILGMDITDRKEAELERNKLWRAVESSPLCIVITDIHGAIEHVNPAFSQITGYTFQEAEGENPRFLKSDLHDAAFYADLWQTIAAGKTWHGEICNRKKNGELFWEQAAISPVKNEDGQVVNYVAVKQDVSDRKNLERLKEDVERIMRHDLKNPLNAIIGIPQIMGMEDNLTQEQREFIGMIETSGQRMLEMIDMSLDIYKMENGVYLYEPAPVDLTSVFQRIKYETQSLASAKNATLRFEYEFSGLPVSVSANSLFLTTMLSNLVVNALEASPPDESVEIIVRDLDDSIETAVHNTGVVPEAIRKDFFQKYATHGKQKGTGLGTYSAKLIAETMNGSIRMTTSETTGTVVSVVLPKACGGSGG